MGSTGTPSNLLVAAEVTRRADAIGNQSHRLLTSAATNSGRRARGFTLIELIFVMLLLAVAASMIAPRMSSFFRGRALNFEARRMLSLAQYAHSRAVGEGVPVLLWINTQAGRYGIDVQGAHAQADDRTVAYTIDPSLTLSVPVAGAEPVSELEDEKLGAPEGLPVIRFTPDGFIDEVSVTKIVIRLDPELALEVAQKPNRLGYEIRPATGME